MWRGLSSEKQGKIRASIYGKWKERNPDPANPVFVRYKNGNASDLSPTNLETVSINDALMHIRDWTVDCELVCSPGL